MKILYLIDSKKYSYHKSLISVFTDVVSGDVIDMSDGKDLGLRYKEIEEAEPDVLITFDLAGFELRTGSDTLSLNNIYARMAHILFHKSDFYGRTLESRQNLSMFTYIPEGEDAGYCHLKYTEVPNIFSFPPFEYKTQDEDTEKRNMESVRSWWESFKSEAML